MLPAKIRVQNVAQKTIQLISQNLAILLEKT
jgi:hypothetical protein